MNAALFVVAQKAADAGEAYCRDLFNERVEYGYPTIEEQRELLLEWRSDDQAGDDGLGDIACDHAREAGVDMDNDDHVNAWGDVFCASFHATSAMLLARTEAILAATKAEVPRG